MGPALALCRSAVSEDMQGEARVGDSLCRTAPSARARVRVCWRTCRTALPWVAV